MNMRRTLVVISALLGSAQLLVGCSSQPGARTYRTQGWWAAYWKAGRFSLRSPTTTKMDASRR